MGQGRVRTEDCACSDWMTACHPSPIFIGRRREGFVPGYTSPPCTSVKDRKLCPEMKSLHQPMFRPAYIYIGAKTPHIFPPEGYSALDTVYISYSVVPGRHLAITRFAFDDVYPTDAYRVSFCPQVERPTR